MTIKINNRKLQAAAKSLNESGLLKKKKLTYIGIKTVDLAENFVNAVESVPDSVNDDEFPEGVFDIYDEIIKQIKESEEKDSDDENLDDENLDDENLDAEDIDDDENLDDENLDEDNVGEIAAKEIEKEEGMISRKVKADKKKADKKTTSAKSKKDIKAAKDAAKKKAEENKKSKSAKTKSRGKKASGEYFPPRLIIFEEILTSGKPVSLDEMAEKIFSEVKSGSLRECKYQANIYFQVLRYFEKKGHIELIDYEDGDYIWKD